MVENMDIKANFPDLDFSKDHKTLLPLPRSTLSYFHTFSSETMQRDSRSRHLDSLRVLSSSRLSSTPSSPARPPSNLGQRSYSTDNTRQVQYIQFYTTISSPSTINLWIEVIQYKQYILGAVHSGLHHHIQPVHHQTLDRGHTVQTVHVRYSTLSSTPSSSTLHSAEVSLYNNFVSF